MGKRPEDSEKERERREKEKKRSVMDEMQD